MIDTAVQKLITYGIEKNLINRHDKVFIANQILDIIGLHGYIESEEEYSNVALAEVLDELSDYAVAQKLIQDSDISREYIKTKLIAVIMPRPHEVVENFKKLHRISPKKVTQWFYKFSQDTNIIQKYKTAKNITWSSSTKYGRLDFIIDTATPNIIKSVPQEIAYPKCIYCHENEGYAGTDVYPVFYNIRMMPVVLNKEKWNFGYSPYGLYNEEFFVANEKHTPMIIDGNTYIKLFEFLNIFPHYFVGANADVPLVGDNNLKHEHFQGGNCEFAINRADIAKHFTLKRFEEVQTGVLNWPLTTIRIRYKDYIKLAKMAEHITISWKHYTDESANIYNRTDGKLHNTVTPIARKVGDLYELDIILRNNITSQEYLNGIFNIHDEYRNLKEDFIGLPDVLGLGVFPARLKSEIELLSAKILNGEDLRSDERTAKHAQWVEEFLMNYDDISDDNLVEILQNEAAYSFVTMLEDASVFQNNQEGQKALDRFITFLNK